ncbi:conserved hypothetical protein [Beggiatoa sp. PS]|nr:conserved hypothetical protein [Beggiatoa sp. PS]
MLFNRHLFLQTFLVCLPRFYTKPLSYRVSVLFLGITFLINLALLAPVNAECPLPNSVGKMDIGETTPKCTRYSTTLQNFCKQIVTERHPDFMVCSEYSSVLKNGQCTESCWYSQPMSRYPDADGEGISIGFDPEKDVKEDQEIRSQCESLFGTEATLGRECIRTYTLSDENNSPSANFTPFPAKGEIPLAVMLDGSASTDTDGSIVSYEWSSSDGKTASDKTALFTFEQEGNYTITLTVTDNDGLTNSSQQMVNAASSQTAIQITSIISKPEYSGDTYYLYGLDHNVDYTANIDWGAHEPNTVTFTTPSGNYDVSTLNTEATQTFNMGNEFSSCTDFQMLATAQDGETSDIKDVKVNVMDPLPLVGPFIRIDEGNSFYYKTETAITPDLLDLEADARDAIERAARNEKRDWLSLPPLFDEDTSFKFKFAPKLTTEIKSNGQAKFDFEVGVPIGRKNA